MVRLREIPRTAAFSWSPETGLPLIATGTKAGAVDADFSSDTQLELWSLNLEDAAHGAELEPLTGVATDSRFHDITWVSGSGDSKKGIIAGALESGSLNIWDADKLLSKESNPLLSKTAKHTGAIKALQFNAFRHELLATAGAKGELFISDLNNIANPFRLGGTAARADDFDCLDWNKKVPHIIVTGSNGGFVTVWDVKSKKESLTLNNFGRKAVSSVVWDPEKPTRLITAVPLDTDPLILVWDLRNSNTPEKVLRGHEGGVLSLSWCRQDNELLLSCGKDNRTICWNPQSGEAYGELPVVTNWTFQTQWNPRNPSLLATASFDGKIGIHTIQNTRPISAQAAPSQAVDGEDFFNKAQSQPQISSFSLPKPPRWLERPCGVSFGFGGRILRLGTERLGTEAQTRSSISLSSFAIDNTIGDLTEAFSKAMSRGNFKAICETRVEQAALDFEKTDWKVIETLITENPRKELINYLGIAEAVSENQKASDDDLDNAASDLLQSTSNSGTVGSKRLSTFFAEAGTDEESFLANLASTKGAKTNNPFHIYSESESEAEKRITQALILGDFERAMDACLTEGRLSDAFMIAICGGQSCMQKVQTAYFKKQASGPRYLRLLASVVGKNLWDIVYNADLQDWKEVMATLCTYASAEEFPDLCEALGDRLEDRSRTDAAGHARGQDASFCYIAGSKLEKVVGVWIAEIEYNEVRGHKEEAADSDFSIHARALQNFIEKVTVFREVTKYQDKDRTASSDWRLAALYEKYIEYADIVAAHGQLQTAERFLDLLPDKYPAADVSRNRVKQATGKLASAQPTKQQAAMNPTFPTARAAFQETIPPAVQPTSQYMQAHLPQATGPYAPQNAMYPTSHYQPSQSIQAPPGRPIVAPPPSFGAPSQGPPRTSSVSPAVPPPSKANNPTNWNDTPEEFFKPPASRRGTPAMPPTGPSPSYPSQSFAAAPAVASQLVIPKATPAPPPPPPKGPAPPPRTQTPQTNSLYQPQQQPPERPPSSAANVYAPPPMSQAQPPIQAQRGPSPYNPPPPGAHATPGRYAPAGGPQQQPVFQAQHPASRQPPPPNPFASRQTFSNTRDDTSNAVSHSSSGAPVGGSLQAGQISDTAFHNEVPLPRTQKPPSPKYPPGDRSHIPPAAQRVYEFLNHDLQRIKASAPSSFKNHVNDVEKRLNVLFDHLNNETLLRSNTIQDMDELAQSLRAKDYEKAMSIHLDLITNRTEECGNWMIGVKRLISMSRATPQ